MRKQASNNKRIPHCDEDATHAREGGVASCRYGIGPNQHMCRFHDFISQIPVAIEQLDALYILDGRFTFMQQCIGQSRKAHQRITSKALTL